MSAIIYPWAWRWTTAADPNRPRDGRPYGLPREHRIRHPLAARRGWPCRRVCRDTTPGRLNGNVLIEFMDGRRVVAPRWSIGSPPTKGPA